MITPGTIYTDRYDRRVFSELSGKAPVVSALEQRGTAELAVFNQLLADLWASLYKADPLLKAKEKVRPVEQMSRTVVEKLLGVQQYQELREYTTLDEFATTMALPILGEAALQILLQKKQQVQKLQQQQKEADLKEQEAQAAAQAASEAQGEADDAQAEADEAQAQGDPQAGQKQQQAQQARAKAEQAVQATQQAQMTFEQAQELLEQQAQALLSEISESQVQEQMRRAMRKAAKQALEKTEETLELLEAWGVEPGEIQKLSFEEKLALAQKLRSSKRLKEIAKLAGRFRRLAVAKQKEKVSRRAGVVTNIKRGRDLRRLIPSERRMLAHPFMRLEFLRRYATSSLFVYELEDKETKGEGPVIFCLDQSGSISDEQEIWMKAVALGLFQAAGYRNRDFIYIHYGGPSDPLFVVRLKTGQAKHQDLIRIAEYSLGGGTDFEKPLAEARKYIEAGLPADIMFFTDGQCAVSGQFLADFNGARRKVPFSVYSLLLNRGGRVSDATLKQFSDEVRNVSDLTTDEAGEIFALV